MKNLSEKYFYYDNIYLKHKFTLEIIVSIALQKSCKCIKIRVLVAIYVAMILYHKISISIPPNKYTLIQNYEKTVIFVFL